MTPSNPSATNTPGFDITWPTNGTVFLAPAEVRITVTDLTLRSASVDIYANSIHLGQAEQLPVLGPFSMYALVWSNAPAGQFALTARGATREGLKIFSAPVNIVVEESMLVPGKLHRDVYWDIPGITLADLTNAAKFPNAPDLRDTVAEYEVPHEIGENYGTRLWGYLLPPITGDYVFYIASDDQGALFLSPDENPANMVKIAHEPQWNMWRQWQNRLHEDGTPHKSAPIGLVAGRRYYTEAWMKEGGGGDCLSVAWQMPGAEPPVDGSPPIPGECLAILDRASNAATITITSPANGITFPAHTNIVIKATAIDPDGAFYTVDFYAGTDKIGSSTIYTLVPVIPGTPMNHQFTWTNVVPGTYSLTVRGRDRLGITICSAPVQITVNPPVELPKITVTATDATASEMMTNNGGFTITRTGSTASALTVQFNLSGTAVNGVDYERLTNQVVIVSGTDHSHLHVRPINDELVETNETVILTILPGDLYRAGSPSNAIVTIEDNDRPPNLRATIAITSPTNNATFTAPTNVVIEARAVDPLGAMYITEFYAGTIRIGASTIYTLFPPIPGTPMDHRFTWTNPPVGSHVLTVKGKDSHDNTVISPPVEIHVTAPTALPLVTVTTPDAQAAEIGNNIGWFKIARTGSMDKSLTVRYSLSGTASNGVDYTRLTNQVTIASGVDHGRVEVKPLDDQLAEGNETVALTLVPGDVYRVGAPSNAVVTIEDKNAPMRCRRWPSSVRRINMRSWRHRTSPCWPQQPIRTALFATSNSTGMGVC